MNNPVFIFIASLLLIYVAMFVFLFVLFKNSDKKSKMIALQRKEQIENYISKSYLDIRGIESMLNAAILEILNDNNYIQEEYRLEKCKICNGTKNIEYIIDAKDTYDRTGEHQSKIKKIPCSFCKGKGYYKRELWVEVVENKN